MEMRSLVSVIEAYLKELLRSSPEGWIEVKRREIAEQFDCVPSQITYVINTRFNTRHGYLVESRRGGGGYIRIARLYMPTPGQSGEGEKEKPEEEERDQARAVLYAMARRGLISEREFIILNLVFETIEDELSSAEGDRLKKKIIREIIAESGFNL